VKSQPLQLEAAPPARRAGRLLDDARELQRRYEERKRQGQSFTPPEVGTFRLARTRPGGRSFAGSRPAGRKRSMKEPLNRPGGFAVHDFPALGSAIIRGDHAEIVIHTRYLSPDEAANFPFDFGDDGGWWVFSRPAVTDAERALCAETSTRKTDASRVRVEEGRINAEANARTAAPAGELPALEATLDPNARSSDDSPTTGEYHSTGSAELPAAVRDLIAIAFRDQAWRPGRWMALLDIEEITSTVRVAERQRLGSGGGIRIELDALTVRHQDGSTGTLYRMTEAWWMLGEGGGSGDFRRLFDDENAARRAFVAAVEDL
jgi:hypothetical protein